MAFDGLFIHSLLNSIRPILVNGRLAKIYQPFEHDVVLTFRKERKNYQLLVSANPQFPKFYLTKQAIHNPDQAPTFVMVLRKYLEGSVLQEIEQVGLDRIVNFSFSNRNELGDQVKLVLSVELMGRHSNVILYDAASGHIIDLLKRIAPEENRVRLLLPKAKYELPPLIPGINGFKLTEKDFEQKAQALNPADFAKQVSGLDRDDRRELSGYLEDAFSYSAFKTFMGQFDQPQPSAFLLKTPDHQHKLFPYLPYHLDLIKEGVDPDFNHALEQFYLNQSQHDWVKQKAGQVERVVKNERKKLSKKISKLEKQLDQAENSENYRICGEILNANLGQVKSGMTKIVLPNYYDNNQPLEIKLDSALSPARNGQKYFTRYKKLRDSIKHVKEQITLAQSNLAYFETIQTAIDNAEPQDIDQITDELTNQGYLKRPQKQRRRKKMTERNLNRFRLTSGKQVLVGKNNYQNDWLTFKKASKTDMWFHVKDIPGSHVILQDDQPSPADILETAEIAAYFSKGKDSAHVQVDYVQTKRVKKPNGAKPGFVIYTGQNSIEVTPEKDRVLSKRID
ncbi:Rqc2 family fibronectin-binding protein [Lactobacillus xylocopicola]|uniref:Rqc2 homolog RqcH n=1 Tax=Lactobacillus xylocopicola TaxID=2976676 RepID=A0ABN6SLK1_9LACO|nr:NFACT RNA binding domain-containing protein [Lactobacillus xylocopicola]BDR60493.1 hypothetical protein KIM322_07540 [Lactobacillus xylocopicola]